MSPSPRAADRVRKAVAYVLAVVLTVLLFRVLSRVANGTQRLLDWEWPVTVVLCALAILWVRSAKRVRPAVGSPPRPVGGPGRQPPVAGQ